MQVVLKRVWFTPLGRFRPDGERPLEVPDELFDQLPSDARVVGEVSPAAPSAPVADAAVEDEPEEDEPVADLTATDVIAMQSQPFMSFKAAAKRVLGDACPSGKADILTALKELE